MDSGLVTDVDTVVDDAVVDDAVVDDTVVDDTVVDDTVVEENVRTKNITDEEGGEKATSSLGPRSFTTEHCDNIIQKK
jgi:hypothetical protein